MRNKCKSVLIPVLLLVMTLMLCACGNQSQFDVNDENGYTVSVKFDANGGEFTTNCYEIVDSFNIAGMATNSEGLVELALIAPDNNIRGANDTFTAAKNGYFLAGWYQFRNEVTDENGNVTYTYSGKWDFETSRLKVDPNKQYSSANPEITLYAAWIPMFEVNFLDMDGNQLDTYTFNPTSVTEILTPQWSEETGAIEMYKFPKQSGKTFVGAYYDLEGTKVGDTVNHPGSVDLETGTAMNPSMNIYVDYQEGEWYRIYNAQQLINNVSRNGCYELFADLDFTGLEWPATFSYGDFSGKIVGNGKTISNVTIVQKDAGKLRFGLFGSLSATASITDVTFENIVATIQAGIMKSGVAYGLFAGSIDSNAEINGVKILGSTLQIDSGCALMSNDYVFGLVCGTGNAGTFEAAEVTVVAVGDHPESVTIEIDDDGNTLTVKIG